MKQESKISAIGTPVTFGTPATTKFILLTTYRKNGALVCHSVEDGVIHTTTRTDTGKAKRIRNQSRALISATVRRHRDHPFSL